MLGAQVLSLSPYSLHPLVIVQGLNMSVVYALDKKKQDSFN